MLLGMPPGVATRGRHQATKYQNYCLPDIDNLETDLKGCLYKKRTPEKSNFCWRIFISETPI